MHHLMLVGLLPDSQRVSREAAERHAVLAARETRVRPAKWHRWARLSPRF